jgi:hypothetical protein
VAHPHLMKLLSAIVISVVFFACQSVERCPINNPVRMKRSSGYSVKAYRLQMRERAQERKELSAQRKQLLKVMDKEGKKLNEMEDWDCPRPDSRQAKLIRKQWKKKVKDHEEALRREKEKADESMITLN